MDVEGKEKSVLELDRERKQLFRDKLRQLGECEEIVSSETVNAIGRVTKDVRAADDNAPSSDEHDEDLEEEYQDLNHDLDLPDDTYSLTEIRPELPPCVRYGVRSGLTHLNMSKFSPLSRGHQGGAIAIAAFATTTLYKSRCWNEAVIDQIVEDGDTFYCESYKDISTDDRRSLSILDLKRDLFVQHKLNVNVSIEDPAYAGKFRSQNPKELHLVKALDLFFKRNDAGILTSSVLNIAIWKDPKYYNIFDGQARKESCEPAADGVSGTAKLFLVKDLMGVLFIILEKSNVQNEPFVLYAIAISGVEPFSLADDPDEPEKSLGKPRRRPSGYKVQERYRAVVQGSYHLMHSSIPEVLRGRGHLIVALSALIYSRLINAKRWTTALIDLIFNQANIYLVDLVRVLEKKFDEEFELRVDDLMGDVILGVYSAKVKVRMNVIPGYGKKKGKATIDGGIREFFESQVAGILEIKKFFYAIWKEDDTYYFLDPFACDDEGYRINYSEATGVSKTARGAACVTMNSSVNEVVETVLENTGNKDRDPFLIHGVKVLYVKTGVVPGGPFEKVIYREKGTSRRPQAPPLPLPVDTVEKTIDMTPRVRPELEKTKNASTQFPDLMKDIDLYMMKENEPLTYVVVPPDDKEKEEPTEEDEEVEEEEEEEEEEIEEETDLDQPPLTDDTGGQSEAIREDEDEREDEKTAKVPVVKHIRGYRVINPRRIVLQGTKNCLDEGFQARSRGRQGLISGLTALAYRRLKNPTRWRNMDVDQIVDVSNKTYEDVVAWILEGRPEIKVEGTKKKSKDDDEDEEEEDEEEDEEADAEEEEEEETEKGRRLIPAPSHLDMSMLPVRLKLGDNDVFFKTKMKIIDGEANPLANLAEALESYFKRSTELIFENKRLMYAVWHQDSKYFFFNPYGSDEEGWRLRNHPASLAVTGSLNELVDLLHGVLEFNDPLFALHFVALDSIQPGKYVAPEGIVLPEDGSVEKFRTTFLPITDEDLLVLDGEHVDKVEGEDSVEDLDEVLGEDREEVEEEEEEEEDEEEEEEEDEEDEGRAKARARTLTQAQEKPLVDPLLEVEEQDQPDAPFRLNLILLTSNMRIYDEAQEELSRIHEEVLLEKLKYDHPPPYVMPPKKTLATLLEAKRAKRSVHSLVSRFSIDSRLEVKRKGGFSSIFLASKSALIMPMVDVDDEARPSKMIKLSEKRYLYSRVLPISLMPLRAINDKYIQDEDVDRAIDEQHGHVAKKEGKDFVFEEVPEVPVGVRITPELIPLGPVIKTPTPMRKTISCLEKKKRKCMLAKGNEGDSVIEKMLCNTEDILFELFFPDFKVNDQLQEDKIENNDRDTKSEDIKAETTTIRVNPSSKKKDRETDSEPIGFQVTEDEIGIISGNMCLKNRAEAEVCHLKSCFFSAMLCILAKIKLDPEDFRGSMLDQCVYLGDKIYSRTGKLRYKPYRWFHKIEILNTIYNVIVKQAVYADPESCEDDELESIIDSFLAKHQTGILVFPNCSYAFWTDENRYYLFDPYACDEKGNANEAGYSCLMKFCDRNSMLERIKTAVGENAQKPYRLYVLSITHMETRKRKKKRRRKRTHCAEKAEEEIRVEELEEPKSPTESETSLIESIDWVTSASKSSIVHDMTIPGFAPIRNYDASMLDVGVLENEITTPLLAPFKKTARKKEEITDDYEDAKLIARRKIYDRTFTARSSVTTPLDLCIMAWSLIHDPITWSVRTIRGLFEASVDYTFDSVLATEDSTVSEMTDGLLPEFEIANYVFRTVFVPLHYGTLYATEGWNLAMSLQRVFDTPSYTGAIVVCGDAHVGVTKSNENYFAWWTVRRTKNLRVITSVCIREMLRLIVREINQVNEEVFIMRVITISYAQKMDPDCSDTRGLHEPLLPTGSLPEVHTKDAEPYDLEAIFRQTVPDAKPIFIVGTVALSNRDSLMEPKVKRCYFVALLTVMVKRDIVQSPVPGMIDKVIEVAESLYREFSEPKYHSEHILRNVTVMNRTFDFRDCASPMVTFTVNPRSGRNDFYLQVRKHLKKHFKVHASGILHFTNCCYGFWHSRSTNCYYFLDPYRCNARGRKVTSGGAACLCIFTSICQMVKHMCLNQFEETTGFFIHRLHVDSINVPPFKIFTEDPMWLYLDYNWNFRHAPSTQSQRRVTKERDEEPKQEGIRQSWNNYAIEVSNLIYSVWGTIGSYDSRFGDRAGKNQAAICVAALAMQFISHPSRWNSAILDSAVICGDSYYTESLRSSVQKCAKHFNRFNLQSCFNIFPHQWSIEFREGVCGVLYGARNRMSLAAALKLAFTESPNILVECNNLTLAAAVAKDGYYAVDPCWVGPPLFHKDHGAIYVLRCRNSNTLVYAITKMLNTNQRLEFRVTPIALTFEQQDFNFMDTRASSAKKQILLDPVRKVPGRVETSGTVIPGASVVPDEDSYLCYRENLVLGLQRGHELENPQLPSPQPKLERDNLNNTLVSTTWHLNVGQAEPLKKSEPPFDPLAIRHAPEDCQKSVVGPFEPQRTPLMSITDLLAACDDYPKVVDFTSDRGRITRPLDCAARRDFISEDAREEFFAWTTEMRDEVYRTYKHRLPKYRETNIVEEVEDTSGKGDFEAVAEGGTNEVETVTNDSPDTEAVTEATDEDTAVTETDVTDATAEENNAD